MRERAVRRAMASSPLLEFSLTNGPSRAPVPRRGRINSVKCSRVPAGIKAAMSPLERALWYIEAHLKLEVSLADVAASASVSRHHLLRAFGAATGLS